ncbi:SRPBCC family protein [Marisediminicola senii]|uniref:SRPBCC family protein n=1 Tax=Marisediminicola senii TaxID=2711233 RepID=UPI0013ED015B|nr:SRPBCC family protein [Marisediminicola senii]
MATNYRMMACAPEDLFNVLTDGWLFPSWVVGAARIRDVDESWPAEGSKLYHSFGMWPMLLDDTTTLEEWDAPHHVKLRARGWPMGEAFVQIDVKPRGEGCIVRMIEDAILGPGRIVPQFMRDPMIHMRNTETLHRLAYMAEGRARTAVAA